MVPAGRRSYKTETRKRKLILGDPYHPGALTKPNGAFFFGAPTREQAKLIAWKDLKLLSQPFWEKRPLETELIIYLLTGSVIQVIGMDKPERIEGRPWDGGVLDEYGNMRKETWSEHVRPALADTLGWCDFIGVPEGLNHYYELNNYAKDGSDPNWDSFTWKSADVLSNEEIDALRRELDPRTFRQECEASFEGVTGRVCYGFNRTTHKRHLEINYNLPLYFTFDFNVDPMTTSVCQLRPGDKKNKEQEKLLCILRAINTGNSHTQMQCDILKKYLEEIRWEGMLNITGDASNPRRTESNVTNWQIVQQNFPPAAEPGQKAPKAYYKLAKKNPPEIDTANCLNAKIMNAKGEIGFYVNDTGCEELIKDLEQCIWAKNNYEIDKSDKKRTHNLDNTRYIAYYEFPIKKREQTKPWSY